jgi:DNA modification methylase
MTRRSTSTSAFGVSKRESHDASAFYRRFASPEIDDGSAPALADRAIDKLIVGDARHMEEVDDASVALVVTSPPYFAGKEYEEALGVGGVPATYFEYLDLLREVFAESVRKLEPGGRIAVNVANLGRRPYRSLSADVIGILQDDLRLLLRGEIVWVKQRGSSGSCAWGSFQRAANPVLRDLTERIVVASKGRFDRALPPAARSDLGMPSASTMTREDFMDNTLDVWEIPPESATRVGHPAPFPVELPARLIEMYTYRDDLVLDPFAGAGSTAVAAVRTGRHFAGYDLDPAYVEIAEARVAAERAGGRRRVTAAGLDPGYARLVDEGRSARELAEWMLKSLGFHGVASRRRIGRGLDIDMTAVGPDGRTFYFELGGRHTHHGAGLSRSEVLVGVVGKAALVRGLGLSPLVLLAAGLPGRGPLDLVAGEGRPFDVLVDLLDPATWDRLLTLPPTGSD